MPFSDQGGGVACLAERFRNGHRLEGEALIVDWSSDPKTTPIPPCEKSRSGRTANRSDIVLPQFDTLGQKLIQVGSRSIPAVKFHISPAKIVGDDENNVGL
jgi:hypothetical protein